MRRKLRKRKTSSINQIVSIEILNYVWLRRLDLADASYAYANYVAWGGSLK